MSALGVSTIMDATLRTTVLLGVAALVTLALRHRSAGLRHVVWSVALTGALIVPAVNPIPQATTFGWSVMVLILWAVGAAVVGARSLVGVWRISRLARHAVEMISPPWQDLLHDIRLELGIRRPVRLLCSRWVSVPMTSGWWRPNVLVPLQAEQWSMERRAVVLRHELVHVKARRLRDPAPGAGGDGSVLVPSARVVRDAASTDGGRARL